MRLFSKQFLSTLTLLAVLSWFCALLLGIVGALGGRGDLFAASIGAALGIFVVAALAAIVTNLIARQSLSAPRVAGIVVMLLVTTANLGVFLFESGAL